VLPALAGGGKFPQKFERLPRVFVVGRSVGRRRVIGWSRLIQSGSSNPAALDPSDLPAA